MRANEPRILLADLETAPNFLTHWGLKVDSGWIQHENIMQERYIICASWKWLGERRTHSASVLSHPSKREGFKDLGILKKFASAIQEADAVVAHNGDKFDVPWAAGRMLLADMKPMKPVVQIDTKKICKRRFYLNSYALAYVAERLGVGKKIETERDLWKRAILGDPAAIKKMVVYNRHDIDPLLVGVYRKVQAWVPPAVNRQLWSNDSRTCPNPACGRPALESRGLGRNRVSEYRRMQCRACGAWSSQPMNSKVVR